MNRNFSNITNLLKPVTSDNDLIELCKYLNLKLDAIDTVDQIAKIIKSRGVRGKSYIILLGGDGGVGHWTAMQNGEYFDSTGVGPPTSLGDLKYNEIQYQGTLSEYCGIYCVLWLYSKQRNRQELLTNYTDFDVDII